MNVPLQTPSEHVPERVPQDLDAHDIPGQGMNVVEVIQGQKFTDVGSLQCVSKVASLCHEETNIQRIIEICRRPRKDEKQERFPRFGAHRFPRTDTKPSA